MQPEAAYIRIDGASYCALKLVLNVFSKYAIISSAAKQWKRFGGYGSSRSISTFACLRAKQEDEADNRRARNTRRDNRDVDVAHIEQGPNILHEILAASK
jgi:hypothetical protein